jgi:hypothetical protein
MPTDRQTTPRGTYAGGGQSLAADPTLPRWIEAAMDAASKVLQTRLDAARTEAEDELAAGGNIQTAENRIALVFAGVDLKLVELNRQMLLVALLRGAWATQEQAGGRDQGPGARSQANSDAPDPRTLIPLVCADTLIEKLPFSEAIEALLKRMPMLKDQFLALDNLARSRAFTMARVMEETWLEQIHEQINAVIKKGETFRDFWGRLKQVSDDTGWIGTTQRHARLVYDVNLGQAYSQGRWERGIDLGLQAWRYLPSISEQPRAEHEQFYGQIFRATPGTSVPPLDFGCACGWEWLLPHEIEDLGIDPAELPVFVPPVNASGFTAQVLRDETGGGRREAGEMGTTDLGGRAGLAENVDLVPCDLTAIATLPRRVLLVPWGEVHSTNGDFICDTESAAKAIQAFEGQGVDLPIDYEHQSMGGAYAAPDGTARAAGWIKKIEGVFAEGIVGFVEWTDRAKELIAGREYRYLSPVVLVRKSDRKVVALHSVALTNKPAIAGMKAIVNRAVAGGQGSGTKDQGPGILAVLSKALTLAARGESADGPFYRRFVMQTNRAHARQEIEASQLPAEEKTTLLKLVDELPDEIQINKAALGPLSKVAEALGEDGKTLAAAVEKGDGTAAAEAITTIVSRQKTLSDELKTTSERLAAVEKAGAEQAWEMFYQANQAKIPPAEKDKWHEKFLTDRKFVQEVIACRAAQVRTEPVKTDGGKLPDASNPEAEWQANKALRDEFGTKEAYIAYRNAEAAGQVRIFGADAKRD